MFGGFNVLPMHSMYFLRGVINDNNNNNNNIISWEWDIRRVDLEA